MVYNLDTHLSSVTCQRCVEILGKGCHLLGHVRENINQTAVRKKENHPALLSEQDPENNLLSLFGLVLRYCMAIGNLSFNGSHHILQFASK